MNRHILSLCSLVLVSACFETHGSGETAVRNDDCYTCHVDDYNGTTAPIHSAPASEGGGCSTQCADCHTTVQWPNGLGGCNHPESSFPLTQGPRTPHAGIACTDCHSQALTAPPTVTSASGANTDCIACHPNDSTQQRNHAGVVYGTGPLAGQAYAYSTTDHRFCLDCHPKGLAIGHDASNPFVLPHRGASCVQCHDMTIAPGYSKDNTNCTSSNCHPRNETDGHHSPGDVPGYMWSDTDKHFCLNSGCHPDGRVHGG